MAILLVLPLSINAKIAALQAAFVRSATSLQTKTFAAMHVVSTATGDAPDQHQLLASLYPEISSEGTVCSALPSIIS